MEPELFDVLQPFSHQHQWDPNREHVEYEADQVAICAEEQP